jgi:DNA-binding response OmpR family regulator
MTPPLRILVADDERDTVFTLMQLLRDDGYDTRGVHKGGDVMSLLESFDPDVVLLDIRRRYGESRPLLIAISGLYKQSAEQILGTMAGFNYFVAKPYDPAALLRLISKA